MKVRLFQAHFRRAVLSAYGDRCCVCLIPERPLLDGAAFVFFRDTISLKLAKDKGELLGRADVERWAAVTFVTLRESCMAHANGRRESRHDR